MLFFSKMVTLPSVFKLYSLSFLLFFLNLSGVLTTYVEIPPPAAAVFTIESVDNSTVDLSKLVKGGSEKVADSTYPDLHRILVNDIVNTDVEVLPGKKVELECMASNPIQWSYRGPGRPEFSTNVAVDVLNNREVHKATLTISNANEKDTGMYYCSYLEFPRISSTYHLFVNGPEIFVSESGRTISYSSLMPMVTIPCPVSVKRAKVTLRKVYNYDNSLRNVDAPIATFDPRFGFRLNVKDMRDADGTYICSGYYQGALRVREYSLRNEERNHTSAVTFPDGLQDDINPCLSYSCPSRSICRVNLNTNTPFCACRPKTGSSVTNCTRLCKTSHDCPKTEKCQFHIDKQLKMCVHVCEGHECAEHAECFVDEQRGAPKCRCRRGFQGNGNSKCERIPLKTVELPENSYCSSTKCGPNARCQNIGGKVQCACYIGYFGSWPNCEKACTQDTDCDLQDRCSSSTGVCEKVCNDNMCAPKAECKVLHRKPMCICPPGYTGKATEACYPSHYYYSSRSGLPAQAEPDFDTTTSRFTSEEIIEHDDVNESLKLLYPANDEEQNTQPSASLKLKR